jgi:orotidine-5'-phosphate decarboxylase
VFADAKLHDIPNTVERASRQHRAPRVRMLNVHALGGEAMMRAARAGADRGAIEAGVPAPTCSPSRCCRASRVKGSRARRRWRSRRRAVGWTASWSRVTTCGTCARSCGDEFCLVVPGIRPAGGNGHDQVRVLTPAAAVEDGADYLVIGRPITAADDPVGVARAILPRRVDGERPRRPTRKPQAALDVRVVSRSRGCVYSPGSHPCPKQRSA